MIHSLQYSCTGQGLSVCLPVAQNPSSFLETLASAVARTSPEIRVHSARCVSIGFKPNDSIKQIFAHELTVAETKKLHIIQATFYLYFFYSGAYYRLFTFSKKKTQNQSVGVIYQFKYKFQLKQSHEDWRKKNNKNLKMNIHNSEISSGFVGYKYLLKNRIPQLQWEYAIQDDTNQLIFQSTELN